MAIYRWVLQLSNRNCRVFVRHLVFLPNFVTLPFELTRTALPRSPLLKGLIRFGLWIWVTWLQVEYPTIWGLNPTMKILNFFFSLISLYNNRNQWQLQRGIFEKNHTFYWTPGAAYYLFPDTTMFIHYSKCFLLFVQNMGTSPQSLALRISISIASADPSSKKQLNHLLSPSAKPSVHCQANYRGGA